MIGFKIGDEFLDLNTNTSVSIELYSPLFQKDTVPGMLTYPITLPYSRTNQRIFGSPEHLSGKQYPVTDFACDFYVEGILWKRGVLKYRGYNGQYLVNFQSDAGDFSARIKDVSIRSVDYAQDTITRSRLRNYQTDRYALFPVKNPQAVGGYYNYYADSTAGFAAGYSLVPFPYLTGILKQIFNSYGYKLSGAWITEEYVRRLCIYNNYQVQEGSRSNFQNHLPDITVSTLLLGLKNLFALGYIFDGYKGEMKVVRLRDVIVDNTYLDWTEKAETSYSDDLMSRTGYTLRQTIEENDELNKKLPTDWKEYKIGQGGEEILTSFSSLHMIRELNLVRQNYWLVPATDQKIADDTTEKDENSKFYPRLLLDVGLQPSTEDPYPMGSALVENYYGTIVSNRSLRYQGANGLYENNWKEWIDFLLNTRNVQRSVLFNMADLLTLDPTRKLMIDRVKYLYEKISFSVSAKEGIGKAKIDLKKVTV